MLDLGLAREAEILNARAQVSGVGGIAFRAWEGVQTAKRDEWGNWKLLVAPSKISRGLLCKFLHDNARKLLEMGGVQKQSPSPSRFRDRREPGLGLSNLRSDTAQPSTVVLLEGSWGTLSLADYHRLMKDLKVDKRKFDAVLRTLIDTKPLTFKETVAKPKLRKDGGIKFSARKSRA